MFSAPKLCAETEEDTPPGHIESGGCRDAFCACRSLVGQSIGAIVDAAVTNELSEIACDNSVVIAEFCIAWPPTFPAGGPAEVVELRAAVAMDAAHAGACGRTGIDYGYGGAAAASSVCGRLLCVREDVVVGEERVEVDAAGRASARLRLTSKHSGVTSCVLAACKGLPTLQALRDSAPLLGLPPAAREEAHRLLWRMMHEALPPNHSALPFDPEAFSSPLGLLPAKLQAALGWAWTHHFRAFAHDWSFLLESPPAAGQDGSGPSAAGIAHHLSSAGGCGAHVPEAEADGLYEVEAEADEAADYGSVMVQMVSFLRDNHMFACLATLLQTAVDRGLQIGPDGSCHFGPAPAAEHCTPPGPPVATPTAAAFDDDADETDPVAAQTSSTADVPRSDAIIAAPASDGKWMAAAIAPTALGSGTAASVSAGGGPAVLLRLLSFLLVLGASATTHCRHGAIGMCGGALAACLPYIVVTFLPAVGFGRMAGAVRLGAAAGHATMATAAALAASPAQALASVTIAIALLVPTAAGTAVSE